MWANYDDALGQIQSAGLLISDLVVNTPRPVRAKIDGDREARGWYWLADIPLSRADGSTDTYIVGSYGIWRGNDNGATKITLSRAGARLSEAEKSAIAARHRDNAKRAKLIREVEADRASQVASSAWRKYVPTGESAYLTRKCVGAHGIRFSPSGNGTIAIPMADASGRIWGLQIIRDKAAVGKREKEYWPKGLAKIGRFHTLGALTPGGIVLIVEGYATGASLHEATNLPVVIAFDAGNLLPVAQAIRAGNKTARIVVCADDDYLTAGNPGVAAARSAALAVSGVVAVPEFPFDRAGKKITDFNDLAVAPEGGSHRVRVQIEQVIREAGWRSATPPAGGPPTGGGGNGNRPTALAIMPFDDAVERFLPIDDGTGKYLFDTWAKRLCHRDQMIALLPAGIRWDDVKRHPTWLTRGAYYLDEVGFDPADEDKNCRLNLWSGWPSEPVAGECGYLLELLGWICAGDTTLPAATLMDWVIRWLAYPLQNPGAKMQSALVVHGPQGTGKSLFFEAIAKIYGEYGLVLNQGAIEDKFNADWSSRKLFILADEIVARQEMYHLKNQLKGLITGEWVRVNPKNVAAYKERNHMNIVFLSNEKQPVILENDDRRHCVIWTPGKLDEEFYNRVAAEMQGGGIAALHHYLLNLDLDGFKPWTKPPMTTAKKQLIELGKDSIESFIDDWISGDIELPVCPARSTHVYGAYQTWCRRTGERYPRTDKQFAAHIEKLPGWYRGHKDVYESCTYAGQRKRARVVIPSPDALQQGLGNGREDYRKTPEKTEAQWITDCVFAFEIAMGRGRPDD